MSTMNTAGYNISHNLGKRQLQFSTCMVIALLLHIFLVSIWKLSPTPVVRDVPVRTLSVKLGNALSGKERMVIKEAQAPLENANAVEEIIDSKVEAAADADDGAANVPVLKKRGAAHKKTKKKAKPTLENKKQASGQVAERYVRTRTKPEPRKQIQGNALGNAPQARQQMIASYTQTISLWMNKFKVYPDQARQAGMQGRAIVRIRIDRRGNIHYRILSQRTPYPTLDKAVMDMVRRANPVPPVPDNYPIKDKYLEYMIPVTFKLD